LSSLIVEICKIDRVDPHPNADRLDIATIKGWEIIVGKGLYKIGDTVVYIPIDSVLPQVLSDEYDITKYLHKQRVKPAKLRGTVSYGVILPNKDNDPIGTDMSEKLGITKWNPYAEYENQQEIKKKSQARKNNMTGFWTGIKLALSQVNNPLLTSFGSFIPELNKLLYPAIKGVPSNYNHPLFHKYTDIENAKNFPNMFSEGDEVIVTEKIHGMNTRHGIVFTAENPEGEFFVGSHSVQRDPNAYGEWGIACDLSKEALYWLKEHEYRNAISIILFGEVFGTGIQDMNYNCQRDFRVFDIAVNGNYLNYDKVKELAERFGLKMVPEIYRAKYDFAELKEIASGNSMVNNYKHFREGIVVKLVDEESNWNNRRKILKFISPEYLLRKNATELQ